MAIKSIMHAVLAAVMLLGPAACSKTKGGGPASLGTLSTNGPGIDGVVYKGVQQFYMLSSVVQDQKYTIRTVISTVETTNADGSTTSTPDGNLTITLYHSETAYKNNEAAELTITQGETNDPSVYETSFVAAASGDYVAVIGGSSSSHPGKQFFYDFRLMSTGALTSFTTTTIPAYGVQSTLSSGYLNVYNLADVTSLVSTSTYTISLVTNSTTTGYFPQMYIYNDDSLSINSLQLSTIPTATYFLTYCLNSSPACSILLSSTPTGSTLSSSPTDTFIISQLTLTSAVTGSGPYLVIRGIASSLSYTVSITQ